MIFTNSILRMNTYQDPAVVALKRFHSSKHSVRKKTDSDFTHP